MTKTDEQLPTIPWPARSGASERLQQHQCALNVYYRQLFDVASKRTLFAQFLPPLTPLTRRQKIRLAYLNAIDRVYDAWAVLVGRKRVE